MRGRQIVHSMVFGTILCALAFVSITCSNDDAVLGIPFPLPPAGASFSFSGDVLPILTQSPANQNCTRFGCHGDFPSANLSLKSADAYANLVNVSACEIPALLRVNPGDSDTSYLIIKLEGTQSSLSSCVFCSGTSSCGDQMPFGATPLSSATIQVIRDWIDQGAADN